MRHKLIISQPLYDPSNIFHSVSDAEDLLGKSLARLDRTRTRATNRADDYDISSLPNLTVILKFETYSSYGGIF